MVFSYFLVTATCVPSLDVPEQQTTDVEFITFFFFALFTFKVACL